MKHQRAAAEQALSLALSLSLGAAHADRHRNLRRAGAAATASGEFVCKTCGRSFPTFQALGGHRTSHLRGRHGLALALAGDHYSAKPKKSSSSSSTDDDQKPAAVHQCHVCGVEFEMGQALGGHMRRHRDEAAAVAPPVLLQLFV
uniref:Uncharacterized protein n=1 Tax=Avena sativa TaxID=4498 RepID=A0ACD5X9F1_AVESA